MDIEEKLLNQRKRIDEKLAKIRKEKEKRTLEPITNKSLEIVDALKKKLCNHYIIVNSCGVSKYVLVSDVKFRSLDDVTSFNILIQGDLICMENYLHSQSSCVKSWDAQKPVAYFDCKCNYADNSITYYSTPVNSLEDAEAINILSKCLSDMVKYFLKDEYTLIRKIM